MATDSVLDVLSHHRHQAGVILRRKGPRMAHMALGVDQGETGMGSTHISHQARPPLTHQAASKRAQVPPSAGPTARRIRPNISRQ